MDKPKRSQLKYGKKEEKGEFAGKQKNYDFINEEQELFRESFNNFVKSSSNEVELYKVPDVLSSCIYPSVWISFR